ncbi:hypothetical protein [Microbacterium sp. SMR1]|uniref:hypothetical protein n=1 Tax=Microbacterium sp. SMR1 TaxID=1497340 RepID=UPI0011BE0061|nr:hypothetical protein [Microbacterium sp. SMR1]
MTPSPTPTPVAPLAPLVDALAPYTDVISAFAAIITAVIAVVALASTARDSRERSRPLVMALFREAEHSDSSFEFVVRNYGTSAARDLTVTFDPPFSEEQRQDGLTDTLAKRYDRATPILPPGSELTNVWWAGGVTTTSHNELVNHMKTPDEVTVSVSYKGNRWRRYSDTFTLHVDAIKLTTTSVSSTSMPGRMKTLAESAKKIADELRATNRQLREIERRLPSEDRENEDAPPSPKVRRSIPELLAMLRPGR